MTRRSDDEPRFFVLDYVTITRDPRTQLVVAIGGGDRAAGILQTVGGFHADPGVNRDFHRLPHDMPVEDQRHSATATAHALLLAGHGVHLDPSLNILTAPDGDRQAARRYLDRLAQRARAAETDRDVTAVLAEIAAPAEGLLSQMVQSLISTWATWGERLREAGLEEGPAEQLMEVTSSLSHLARRIAKIRDEAARQTPPTATPPRPAVSPPPLSSAPSARRR
jgi:hypothetical protein